MASTRAKSASSRDLAQTARRSPATTESDRRRCAATCESAIDDKRDVGAAALDAIRYMLVDEPEHAAAARQGGRAPLFAAAPPRSSLCRPRTARDHRARQAHHLERTAADAVLAAAWLAALHATRSAVARRIHARRSVTSTSPTISAATGAGSAMREKLDRIVESHLQVAAPGRRERRVTDGKNKKIGFVGAGNMAGALIKGLLHSGTRDGRADPGQRRARRAARGARQRARHRRPREDNDELAAWADVVVLAVKPQVIDKVLAPIGAAMRPDALVVSIAAGVPIEAIEARLPHGARVVRTMPNTAAIALAGATAIAPGTHAIGRGHRRRARALRGDRARAWCSTKRCSTR